MSHHVDDTVSVAKAEWLGFFTRLFRVDRRAHRPEFLAVGLSAPWDEVETDADARIVREPELPELVGDIFAGVGGSAIALHNILSALRLPSSVVVSPSPKGSIQQSLAGPESGLRRTPLSRSISKVRARGPALRMADSQVRRS